MYDKCHIAPLMLKLLLCHGCISGEKMFHDFYEVDLPQPEAMTSTGLVEFGEQGNRFLERK